MRIIKLLLFIFFIFFLVIVNVSWNILPSSLNILFIFIIINILKNRYNNKALYVWLGIIFGGIFLDLYSVLPDGIYLASFLLMALILYKFILSEFSISNHFHVFIISSVACLFFKIIVLLLSRLSYYLGLSDILLNVSFLYILSFAVLNSFLIFLLYGWNIRYKIKR